MDKNFTKLPCVPLSFGMELAKNTAALDKFCSLDGINKEKIIQKAENIHSKNEMKNFVESLLSD